MPRYYRAWFFCYYKVLKTNGSIITITCPYRDAGYIISQESNVFGHCGDKDYDSG